MSLKNNSFMKQIAMLVLFFFVWQTIYVPAVYAFDTGTGDMHGGTPTGSSKKKDDKGKSETPQPPVDNPCDTDKPVSLLNGEKTYTYNDFTIPGRGMSVNITHIYKSQRDYNGRWGYGWFLNYDIKIKKLENNNLLIIDGTSRKDEYIKTESGYQSPKGFDDTLTENIDGTYTRTLKNGTKYEFDLNGSLSRITDKNNNSIFFTYDAGKQPITGKSKFFVNQETGIIAYDYKLTKITDTSGRDVLLSYNENGRLAKITDPANRSISYSYDEEGNLTRITDPLGDSYSYTYDTEHNLTSVTNPEGIAYLKVTYNAQDQVSEETHNGETLKFSYDTSRKTAVMTRSNGSKIYYEMSSCCGNPTKVIRDYGGMNLEHSYEYDENMNMLSEKDPRGYTTRYTYDDKGNILTITDADDSLTSFTYDETNNQITSITDALSRVTRFDYDTNENLTKITDALSNQTNFTYDAYGNLLTSTDAQGKTTSFTYDAYGYISSVKDALNQSINLTYDTLGNLTSLTDRNGRTTSFSYDLKNQLIQITDALGNATRFTYDRNGNRTRITDALNNAVTFAYDEYNRIKSIANALNNATFFSYDVNGNLKTITDAEGNTTGYEYDSWDRLQKAIDALGNVTEYSYDANGNLTSIKDAKGNSTDYAYDRLNRLTMTTYPDKTTETYTYNKAGNLVSKTDRSQSMTAFSYDSLNRLVTKTYTDGNKAIYAYDAVGRMTSVTSDGSNAYSFAYDDVGRVIQAVQNGKTVSYEYDAMGNRTKLIYPDGTYITYLYDALNRMDQIKNMSDQVIADYSYDSISRRTQLDLSNGTQALYQYDQAGRLTNLMNKVKSPEAMISSFVYGYDRVGNRTSMTTAKGVHSYLYDKIYQLTNADYPADHPFADTKYNFDAVANRTSVVNGGTVDYTVNNLNQYVKAGNTEYKYDGNGNLTYDGKNNYEYDYENRLIQAKTPTDTVLFGYDGFGRRITKTDAEGAVAYVYDGDQIIAEYDGAGNLLKKFVYGTGIDEPLVMDAGAIQYFYHRDGLGSVTEMTDSTGTVKEKYEYDVYGKPVIKDGTGAVLEKSAVGNAYLFTGREFDADTGLYYYRARYYSPDLGRFLQTDPVGYMDSMNLYAYVYNNPANWTDSLGLFKFGKRHVKGQSNEWLYNILDNPIGDFLNIEVTHEQGFFEDDSGKMTGESVGFFKNGRFQDKGEDPNQYEFDDKHYDDNLMRKALENLKDEKKYQLLINNCQGWAERLRQEYRRLEKELEKNKEKKLCLI